MFQLKNETLKAKIKKERDQSKSRDHQSTSSSSHKSKQFDLRNKLISRVKSATEQEFERQKNRIKKYKSGIVIDRNSKERSPSVNSISSGDSVLSDTPRKKRKKDDESDSIHEAEGTAKRYSDFQLYINFEQISDEKLGPMMPGMGAYPMYNPETGQWMGMYPYPAPFFPAMFPPYANNYSEMGLRGGYRGRYPRSRGRRVFRGRVNHYGNDDRRSDEWYDHKRRRDYRRR